MLKDNQISKLCREAEDFVAEKLCPMLEEMTGETSGDEFKKNLFATMMTVGSEIPGGGLKIVKKDDKFVITKRGADELDEGDPDPESEAKSEKLKTKAEKLDAMGDEMSSLIHKVINCARKFADDKDDYANILASAASTIVEVGGKKAKHIAIAQIKTDVDFGDILKSIIETI